MPLTPQDVRNKLFTSVRLRPGYDEDEVDAFLDEVEQELARLHGEIDELTGGRVPASDLQLATARQDAETRMRAALDDAGQRHAQEVAALRAETDSAVAAASERAEAVRRESEARLAQAAQQVQAHQQQLHVLQQQAEHAQRQAALAGQELARVRGAAGAPVVPAAPPQPPPTGTGLLPPPSPTEDALRRTLLLAQRTADEAVAEARAEAQRIVGDAQRHAAETTRRAEVEHTTSMTRARADYEALASKIEELRGFERDYRSRLRAYLHLQLRDLEAGAPEPPPPVTAPPRNALTDGSAPTAPELEHSDRDVELRPPPLYGGPGGDDAR